MSTEEIEAMRVEASVALVEELEEFRLHPHGDGNSVALVQRIDEYIVARMAAEGVPLRPDGGLAILCKLSSDPHDQH